MHRAARRSRPSISHDCNVRQRVKRKCACVGPAARHEIKPAIGGQEQAPLLHLGIVAPCRAGRVGGKPSENYRRSTATNSGLCEIQLTPPLPFQRTPALSRGFCFGEQAEQAGRPPQFDRNPIRLLSKWRARAPVLHRAKLLNLTVPRFGIVTLYFVFKIFV